VTLPGHAGGAVLEEDTSVEAAVAAIERALDEIGWPRAHLVGNSLGGYLGLQLAARGRALTVVALAPAGGWPAGDRSFEALLDRQRELHAMAQGVAPQAELLLGSEAGRRRATRLITNRFEHIPAELLAHQLRGVAACPAALAMIEQARRANWTLAADRVTCPVRILWGTADQLLPWPAAATRFQREWLPHAEWVVLDDVGHCPQLDVPLETAHLILGLTSP
jgi:pimeloyl-ACP methyl ester carboxylesterase